MGKYKLTLLVGLVILVAMGGVVLLRVLGSNNTSIGEASAASVPDPEEAREIQAIVLEAHRQFDIAARTFDTSGFPSVFVDDLNVPLPRLQHDRLKEWLGTVPDNAGYLTYMTAAYVDYAKRTRLFEEAMAKAMAKGRDYLLPEDYLTSDELRQIKESNRPIPTPPSAPPRPSMSVEEAAEWRKQIFRFDSLEINGDKAVVIFEDAVALEKAILVRRDGKWYMAGGECLRITGP